MDWTGGTSTDWTVASNWCGGVPTSSTDVVIPSGTTFAPVINSAAAVAHSISINPSATLTLSGTAPTLTVTGDWHNSGTFTDAAGTVLMNGTTQTINGSSPTTFNNLTLEGSGAVTLTTIPTINGILSVEATATVAGAAPNYVSTSTLQYKGSAPQTTGIEFPATFPSSGAASGVIIANTAGAVTLNGAKVINAPVTIGSGGTFNTGSFSLTFGDNFANSGTFTPGSSPIVIAGTSLAQSIAGFGTTGLVSMTKTAGTATLTGNVGGAGLTINGTGGTLNLGTGLTHTLTGAVTLTSGTLNGGSSTLNISATGAAWTGTGANFTAGTGTVVFGGVAQTISAVSTFNNLTLRGTGVGLAVKTLTGVPTVNGTLSMEEDATVSAAPTYGAAATLQYNTANPRTVGVEWITPFVATGGVDINNSGVITLNAAKQFGNSGTSVPLTIEATATLATGNFGLTFYGNFVNAGTLTGGSSPIVITGTATQNIAGFTTTGLVSMTKTGGVATLTGNVSGAGLTINGTGGTLNLGSAKNHTFSGTWTRTAGTLDGGSSTISFTASPIVVSGTGGTFTSGTGTVNYSAAGAQTIANISYYNLALSGTGNKIFPAAMTIAGDVTINAGSTADLGSYTHSSHSLNLVPIILNAPSGTYGSSSSAAAAQDDTYFLASSSGILYVNVGCIPGQWIGAGANSNWDNADNWSCGTIPDNTVDVTIPALAGLTPNYPVINTLAAVKSLTLASGSILTMSGANTLTVSGDWTNSGGTYTDATGTVIFNGVSKTIGGTASTNFYNVSTSGAATITTGVATTISGTLTIGDGTAFSAGGFALTVTGNTTIGAGASGILNVTSSSGTKIFSGDITVNALGTFNNSGNSALTIGGNLTNSGTFTTGSGVYTFTGAAKTLTGTLSIPSTTINGTITNSGTLTVSTALAGSGTLTQGAGSTLNLNFTGTPGITTLDASTNANTVVYGFAGTQTLKGTGYRNLSLSTSGAKTMTGVTTIGGNLTLNGSASATTVGTMSTVGGNLTLSGTSSLTTGAALAVTGDLGIGDGTGLSAGAFTFSVGGNTTVGGGASGTLTLASTAKSFSGNVTVGAGATWNNSGNAAITIGGNLANSGTFTAGSGVYTFSGTSKTLSGTLSIPSATISGSYSNNGTLTNGTALSIGGSLLNNGTITASTALSGLGSLTQSTGSTLNINFTGVPAITTLNASSSTNTVNYGFAGTQTVFPTNYSNLTLSNSGVKTFTVNTTIGINYPIDGTFSITGSASANLGTALAHSSSTLFLGGAGQIAGTWGSSASAATNKNGTWFGASATGVLTVTTFACSPGTWYGTTNTDWNTATNWCNNTLPDASTNVIIPSSLTNYPVVGAAAVCNDLSIQTGASVTISGANTLTVSGNYNNSTGGTFTAGAGSTLSVAGNWSNSGTFTPSTGTVNLNGSATQTVTGTTSFTNLTVSNTGTKTFSTAPTVTGIFSVEGSGTVSAAPTYGAAATLQYNTSAPRTTGSEWPNTFSAGTGGVVITNTGLITLNAAKTFNAGFPLTIQNGASLAFGANGITLNGDLINNGGTISGTAAVTITGTATQNIGAFTTTGDLTFTKSTGTANLTGNVNVGTVTFNSANTSPTLSLNSGVTLTSTGAVTIPRAGTLNTLAVGAGNLNAGSIAFTSGGTSVRHQVTISTGTVIVTGDVTQQTSSGSASIVFTGAGTLKFGGASLSTSTGTLTTFAGSTVEYNGAAQTVWNIPNYAGNLTLSGSGAKTLTGVTTVSGNLSLAGSATASSPITTVTGNLTTSGSSQLTTSANLAVNGATGITQSGTSQITTGGTLTVSNALNVGDGTTFTAGAFALTVNGNTNVGGGTSGTLTISSATGTKAFNGDVTVNTGATWNNTAGNAALTLPGNILNNGTFNAGTGVHTFSGTSKTIGGTLTIPSVTVSGSYTNNGTLTAGTALSIGGSLTNAGTLTAGGTLSGAGSLIQGAGSTLNINFASVPTITTIDVSTNLNTVSYGFAGDQAVYPTTYSNLVFGGSGIKTLGSATTINNDLRVNSPATGELGTFTHVAKSLHFDTTLEPDGTYGSTASTDAANKVANFGTTSVHGILYVNTCVPGTWIGVDNVWENSANWSCGTIPTSSIDVVIPAVVGPKVYPTINSAVSVRNITIASGATLTIAGSNSLTVNGIWSNSGTFTANAGALAVTSDATNLTGSTFNANSGTLTVTGNLTNSGTFAAGTGSITLNGVTQSISGGLTYNNVTLAGTGAKTFGSGTTTINGILSVENGSSVNTVTGSLVYGPAATLQYNAGSSPRSVTAAFWTPNFNGTGGVIIKGTGTITLDAAKTFGLNAPLTIENGAVLATANFGLTFGGNFVNNNPAPLNVGSSPITIANTMVSQSIGAFTTTGLVSMTKTGGTATFTGNVGGAGLTISGNGGTLNLGSGLTHTFTGILTRTNGTLDGGSSTLLLTSSTPVSGTGGTFTPSTGTVNFGGTTQTIPTLSYYNLTLSGTGTKTLAGTTAVGNILSILSGSVIDLGSFDHSTPNLILDTPPAITSGVYGGTGCSVPGAITGDIHFAPVSTGGLFIGTCLPGKWLGLTADWNTGTNWCSGTVPTINTDVIIPSGTPNNPVIGAAAVCRSLNINLGATLSITGSNTLSIKGDWINSGTFTPSGTVILNGAAQSISGGTTFAGLTLQSSGGITFGTGTTTINGILSIETGSALTLTGAAIAYGSSATLQYNTGAASRTATAEWPTNFLATGGVIIKGSGGTITMNASKVFGNSTTSVPLNINSGGILATANNQLVFNGDFINAGTLTAGSSAITIAGAITAQTIAGFTTTGTVSMTKSAGTATFAGNVGGGDLTISGLGGTLDLGGGFFTHTFSGAWNRTNGTVLGNTSTLNIAGSAVGTTGTFTAGSGLVNYNGAAQTIAPVTYNNLTLSGSLAKTLPAGTTTINGILSMEGTATTTLSGTLTYASTAILQYKGSGAQTTGAEFPATFPASGNAVAVVISNTSGSEVTLGGSKVINADLTISSNTKLNTSGSNFGLSLGGNFTNNGTFTANASPITISGALTQSIAGFTTTGLTLMSKTGNTATLTSAVNGGALTINGIGGTLDFGSATHTFSGTWTRTNGTVLGNSSTLNMGGNTINTGGTFTPGTSLVNYTAAGAQTIANVTYYNLTLSGSGAKTITGATINNILSMEGTATTTGTLSGGYGSGATLQYKGSAAQTTGIEFPASFSGTGGVIIDNTLGVTLATANKTIGSNLTLTNGPLNTSTFTVSPATVSRTSGWVNGTLILPVGSGSPTVHFPVGDATNYTPVTTAFSGVSVAGTLSVKSTGSQQPNMGSSNFNAAKDVARYWTLTSGGGLAFGTATATLGWVPGDIIGGASYSKFTIGKYSGSAWTYPGFNNRTAASIDATGLTSVTGDFAVSEVPDPVIGSQIVTTNGTFTVPIGVYSIDVYSYGGGGAGGGATDGAVSGGGGGGAVQKTTLAVSPGQVYNITIGAGGTGVTGAKGGDGGNTIFTGTGGTVTANGGKGAPYAIGAPGTFGAGGAGGTGTHNGGTGGTADASGSGGGAGGAGDTGAGGNGSSTSAGAAGTGSAPTYAGGIGGAPLTLSATAAGNSGAIPGAGGSGAVTSLASEQQAGGNGANGQVAVIWSCSNVEVGTFAITSPTLSTCAGSATTVNMSSSALNDGTYNIAYNLTGANTSTHTVTLTMAGGTGSFITDPIPNAGATTLTVTQINCTAVVSGITAVITVNPLPTITTSATATSVCYSTGAQTTPLTYSTTTDTPTTYSIVWNSSPANSFVTVTDVSLPVSPITINVPAGTSAGTYTGTITVKNANGCVSAGTLFTVTVNAVPTITTGGTAARVCYNAGSQTTSLVYSASSVSPVSYSIDWDATANTAGLADQGSTAYTFIAGGGTLSTIAITAGTPAGTYSGTMTITNGNTCAGTQSVTVTVDPVITGNTSGANISICNSTSTILTGGTVTGGSGTYTYLWESSTDGLTGWTAAAGTNNTANYTTATLVTTDTQVYFRRTVTSGNCSDVAAAVKVTVNPVLAGNTSGAAVSICSGSTTTLTGGTVTGGSGTYTYLWESSDALAGTYSAAAGTNNTADYTTATLLSTDTQVYFRRTVTSGGCTDVATSVKVTVNPVIAGNTSGANVSICNSSTTTLTGGTVTGGSGSYTYLWESSADGSTAWSAATGTHDGADYTTATLTTTDTQVYFRRTVTSGGCSDVAAVVKVTVNPVLAGNTSGADVSICNSSTTLLSGGTVTGGSGSYTYLWESSDALAGTYTSADGTNNGANYTTTTLTTGSTKIYFRRTVTSGGCSDVAVPAKVTVIPAISGNTSGSDISICNSSTTTLTGGSVTGGSGSYTYLWESSNAVAGTYSAAAGTNNAADYTTATITTGSTLVYFRRTVTSGSCTDVATPVHVTIKTATSISADPSGYSVTAGGVATALSVTASGEGTLSYQWYSNTSNSNSGGTTIGTNSSSFTPDVSVAGTYYYYVKVTGGCGDATSAVATVTVNSAAKHLDVTVILEGFYSGGAMTTNLNTLPTILVPLAQPYNVAPWNYAGSESVVSIPSGVVDWVLVELRDAPSPATALAATTLPGWPKAYFLKSDGKIVDVDGSSLPNIGNPTITNNLYVIVRHRNHIAIMSATGVPVSSGNYTYDFTSLVSQAYGGSAGYKQIVPGVCGMVSGDADSDGSISVLDFSKWATDFGKTVTYLNSDIDGDGEVSVLDFSKWATNFGIENIPPLKGLTIQGVDPKATGKYRSQVPDK